MPGPFLKFDSSRFGAGDGEEIWREALRPLYEVWRRKEARFRAKIEVWDLGAMLMTRHVAHDDVQFRRTRGKIASTPADQYLVHCLLGGELASEFEGAQQRVPVNSVALRDLAVENVGLARSAPMLTLSIPRAALERRLPGGARLHAAAWGPADPVGAMLAAHVRSVAKLAPEMTADQARTAGEGTLALLASCLLPKAKPAARRDDPRLAPMLRAQAISFIERNLSDPELDAGLVCRAVGTRGQRSMSSSRRLAASRGMSERGASTRACAAFAPQRGRESESRKSHTASGFRASRRSAGAFASASAARRPKRGRRESCLRASKQRQAAQSEQRMKRRFRAWLSEKTSGRMTE